MKRWVCVLLQFSLILSCSCSRQSGPQEIYISVPYDPDSLDPHARNTVSNFAVASNFYEPLVRADQDMKMQPALARSWENPDSYTWIFHLQPNVRFHSGKPMDSEDVVYSFRRLLNDPALEMRSNLSHVAEITALDKYGVKVRTNQPVSIFLNKLNFVLIVPRGSKSDVLQNKVDGTGPYLPASWKPNQEIRLARNERYWGPKPTLRFVTYYLNRSPQEAAKDLQAGRSQMARSNTKDLEEIVRSLPGYEMLIHDSIFVKLLGFDVFREVTPYCNAKTNPFQNKSVRQAVHLAVDRQGLTENLPFYALPLSQLVPPFIFGFNPQIPELRYNPNHARELLSQSGFPEGFSVTLHARNIFQDAASLLQEQLARIGIQVKVENLSSKDFYNRMNNQDASFVMTGVASPADCSNILELAVHSKDIPTQLGNLNFGGYSNSEVDRKIEESTGISDPERRRKVLQNIMAQVMEDLPWIPLYVDQEAYALSKTFSWHPRYDSYIFAHEIRLQ